MNPHIAPIILLVVALLSAVASGLGLTYYFSYYNESGGWDLPTLAALSVIAVIIIMFLWVGSGAKSSSCLSLLPCVIVLELIGLALAIVWINVSYYSNKHLLKYCGTPVDRLTCVALHGNTFCGSAIEAQCIRLDNGYRIIMSATSVLFLCQILGLLVSIKRRSQVLQEEYALIEEMEEAMHRHEADLLARSGLLSASGGMRAGMGLRTAGYTNGNGHTANGNGVYTNGYTSLAHANGYSNGHTNNGHTNGGGAHTDHDRDYGDIQEGTSDV